MDLQVPIAITDELTDSVIKSTGSLDLASGEIRDVVYQDYDVKTSGLPAESDDYEFTSGVLSNNDKDVEFGITVYGGKYAVSASELLEIKVRAAKLFAGVDGPTFAPTGPADKPAGKPPRGSRSKGR